MSKELTEAKRLSNAATMRACAITLAKACENTDCRTCDMSFHGCCLLSDSMPRYWRIYKEDAAHAED